MKRMLLLLVVAALVLAAGVGRAHAAGGTYRITAGGDQNWGPESGATDQTADDKLEATGTMVSTAQRSGADGHADFHVASGPGIVRARLSGTVTVPSNLAYPFNPSLQAVSTTELTISGPDDRFINATVNLHVDGIIETPVCGGGNPCGALSVHIRTFRSFSCPSSTRFPRRGRTISASPSIRSRAGITCTATSSERPRSASIRTDRLRSRSSSTSAAGTEAGPSPTTFSDNFDDPVRASR